LEVDFVLGDNEVAVEVKSSSSVDERHLRGLKAFQEEYKVKECIVVSMDEKPRQLGSIKVLPWKLFLENLWGGKIIK
jgi:predicted AAA+ superfamily ATPase